MPNRELQLEARKIVECKAFELLVEGQTRSSKTFSILSKMHVLMSKYAGSRGLILRKTKESLAQSILQTFEDEVLPTGHYLVENGPQRNSRQSYKYRNGSELVVGGLDRSSRIMGSEYDIVYIGEATECDETDLKHVITRMSCNHFKKDGEDAWQQVILDCNPSWPHHWLNQRFLKLNKNRERLFISHKCNPKFWHETGDEKQSHWTTAGKKYIDNLTNSLTGVEKQRLLHGIWCMGDLLVYADFKTEEHIVDEIPEEFDHIYVGVDFGWSCGSAVVVGFWKEVAYVLETYLYSEKQIADWIKILQDIREKYNAHYKIVADSAEPRSIELIKNAGLPIEPVKKGTDSIKLGVDLVKTRLNSKGLFFAKDCQKSYCSILENKKIPTGIIDELMCYEYDQNTEKPISKYNHALDALRYIFLNMDNKPKFEYVISGDDDFEDNDMWREL